jgi:hypothetical protein
VVAACAAAALGFVGSPRQAAAQNGVILMSGMGGKCLNAEGAKTSNGTRLIGYPCSGSWNEQFNIMADGTIRMGGKCVDDYGGMGKDEDQIVLWDCNGGKGQQWRFDGHRLVGINGKCIDLKGGAGLWIPMVWNQPAILYNCSGADNQLWYKSGLIKASMLGGARTAKPGDQVTIRPIPGVIAAGGGNVVAAGGGNVIAAGGGNVIAAGGGNVIAAGGGNVIAPAGN